MRQETSARPLFVFGKALYEIKANGLQLSFNYFRQSSTWQAIKTKTLEY